MQTLEAARTSDSEKKAPLPTFQERTNGHSTPTPCTEVPQLRLPLTTCPADRDTGVTYATAGHSARTASTSSSVIVDWPVKMRAPDCVATPGKIIRKLVPSEEIWAWIAACEPWPTAIIAITQATPMMMPSAVSAERSLLRPIALRATLRIVRNFSIAPSSAGPPAPGDFLIVHNPAVAEHHRALGVLGDVLLVRDQDDSLAVVVESLKDRHDLFRRLRVEVAGRLVGQDQLRVVDQSPRDRDALLLAARELARMVILAAFEADDRQALAR